MIARSLFGTFILCVVFSLLVEFITSDFDSDRHCDSLLDLGDRLILILDTAGLMYYIRFRHKLGLLQNPLPLI